MKVLRQRVICICLVLTALLLVFSGCGAPKAYYYSFKEEQDLENDDGTWSFVEAGLHLFVEKGISFDATTLCCPLMFSGDLTITWRFWLNCEDTLSRLGLVFSLRDGSRYASCLQISFPLIGSIYNNDIFYITDRKTNTSYDETLVFNSPALSLDYLDINELTLTRMGDHLSLIINDVTNAEFDLKYYESRWFGPMISWYIWEGAGYTWEECIIVESIDVTYTGSAAPLIMYYR